MTSYLIESLKDYMKKNRVSQRKMAKLLGIHYNSVWNWINYKQDPSPLAKSKIREFLIKNL